MKNNKAVQVFLAVALLGIWGTVIYRVVEAMRGDDSVVLQGGQLPLIQEDKKEEFTFALRLDYTDPFLKKASISQEITNDFAVNNANSSDIQAPPPPKVQPHSPKKPIQFPQISYHGMVKNKDTGIKYASLKIWNKSHRMKIGEVKNGIHLVQVERDSIRIFFNGQMKAFGKE